MVIKYRPHRGSLSKAMALYREFTSLEEMLDYVVTQHDGFLQKENLSYSEPMGDDERIGWKSWRYLLTDRYGDALYDIPQCIGMITLEDNE